MNEIGFTLEYFATSSMGGEYALMDNAGCTWAVFYDKDMAEKVLKMAKDGLFSAEMKK